MTVAVRSSPSSRADDKGRRPGPADHHLRRCGDQRDHGAARMWRCRSALWRMGRPDPSPTARATPARSRCRTSANNVFTFLVVLDSLSISSPRCVVFSTTGFALEPIRSICSFVDAIISRSSSSWWPPSCSLAAPDLAASKLWGSAYPQSGPRSRSIVKCAIASISSRQRALTAPARPPICRFV